MKLCPCKKEGLARALLSESKGVLWHEELFCNTIDMLENFCVCEKKEVCSCKYHDDVCVGAPQRNGVCGLCPPNCLEKQSQSSCEHEPDEWNIYCKKCGHTFKKACKHFWKEKKIGTYPYYGEDHVVVDEQWWCQKCGLVTCKNPAVKTTNDTTK